MTAKIRESAKERTLEGVVREQFEAFERQERQIRTHERIERAMKLRLPAAIQHSLALQLQLIEGSESMGDHDSGSDDWWCVG